MAKIQGGCGKGQGNEVVKVLWELRVEMTLDCRNHGGTGIIFELVSMGRIWSREMGQGHLS